MNSCGDVILLHFLLSSYFLTIFAFLSEFFAFFHILCFFFLCIFTAFFVFSSILWCDDQFLHPRPHVLILRHRCARPSVPEVSLVEKVFDPDSIGMNCKFTQDEHLSIIFFVRIVIVKRCQRFTDQW